VAVVLVDLLRTAPQARSIQAVVVVVLTPILAAMAAQES
jgi:hypothetical protein